jgi:hypothetical protein
MKAILLFSLVSILIMGSCKPKESTKIESDQLEGTWNLVYAKSIGSDSMKSQFKLNYAGSQMKIWSKNHFAFVGLFRQKSTVLDNFGGGTYKLSGNQYVESYLYNAAEDEVEMDVKMLLEIKHDTLVQTWPADDNGNIDPKAYNIEKYVRF